MQVIVFFFCNESFDGFEQLIPQDLLKKYIEFARSSVHPQLSNIDQDKISQLYVEMRQQSTVAGGVPITYVVDCASLSSH
jgi:DNA replicative helicase MCM subunit Mcm2 (Cdc46/Mcm family)